MEDKYIVALEIGSSKIKGAIGTVDASGTLSVKTVEEERLIDSVRYGCILNVLETATAIRTVLNRLEQREPQRKITGVYVAVGGRSLMSQEIEIERSLSSEMEITNALINDITDEALSNQLHERTIVGVSPKEFRVDNFPAPRVVGMFGSHISARLNLISCRDQLMRKLNMVLDERLHITINDLFVRPLAEADLVLYPEEKRQGCMFVDCGADTTTVAIYKNGVLMYLSTIPMGSRHITRDITALNILEERAEDLKIQGGNALTNSDSSNMVHNVAGVDFVQINNYVAARAGEIVANVNEQIKYAGLSPDKLPGGIVLVGRGAKLNGFDRRLANITTMNVRFGSPTNRIRILDGRLNGSDHVDVISILAAAAKEKMCVSVWNASCRNIHMLPHRSISPCNLYRNLLSPINNRPISSHSNHSLHNISRPISRNRFRSLLRLHTSSLSNSLISNRSSSLCRSRNISRYSSRNRYHSLHHISRPISQLNPNISSLNNRYLSNR